MEKTKIYIGTRMIQDGAFVRRNHQPIGIYWSFYSSGIAQGIEEAIKYLRNATYIKL